MAQVKVMCAYIAEGCLFSFTLTASELTEHMQTHTCDSRVLPLISPAVHLRGSVWKSEGAFSCLR